MAHLIRSIAGTNREPIYGLWEVCELCPNDPEIPFEAEKLKEIAAEVPQVPGMTLAEFWEAYVQLVLEREIRREL